MRHIFVATFLGFSTIIGFSFNTTAQQFGGNPPYLRWKQVNTDTARIIFPAGLEKQALEVATLVHKLAAISPSTIGENLRKVNIVFQNQGTVANGYAALGPFRSEFYLTPRQNSFELGSMPWHKTLALHEYRHIQQFNNFRKGLSKAFYVFFGEEGQSLANSIAVPDWFWEGDAVYQETVLSNQGRGRIPYFFNAYRSLWASDKKYSWMKLRNGSYRDLVPDHYQLGYMLVAYGYEKYGNKGWKNITRDAAAFKGLFYPFQSAFKRNTGQHFNAFTREAFDYFKSYSKADSSEDPPALFAKQNKHLVAEEHFPQWIDSNHIVYLRSNFKNIPAFHVRNIITGTDKKIRVKAISTDNYFSYRNGKIIYSAYQPHLRWGWKNYEILKVLDINTGNERTITSKTRYLSPDISEDGKKIVAVHSFPGGNNELHILDASTNNISAIIPGQDEFVFTYPKFYDNKNVVAAVRNTSGEMALGMFHIQTGSVSWLTPFTINVIAFPQAYRDTVTFSMSDGTRDRLFAVAHGKIFRFVPSIPNTNTGNYQLSIGSGKYAWTSYTAVGSHIYQGAGTFEEWDNQLKSENNIYPLSRLIQPYNLIRDTTSLPLAINRYSSSFRLFNFHSWRPYISDPEYSYSLISENVLNTLQTEIFFTYNRNENFKEAGASMAYAALFPVIHGGASYTFDRSFRDTAQIIDWDEFNARIGMTVPVSFTKGSFFQDVALSGTFNTKQVYYKGISKLRFEDKRFNYTELGFSATSQQIKARQNIYPKFAQTLVVRYRRILNKYTANQFLINGAVYVPGFFVNHSIVVQAAYQQRDTMQQYTFPNSFPFSRGYSEIDFPRMWRVGINYHFPIVYPDIGFGNIVYLLRVRGNGFYDHVKTKSLRTGLSFTFASAGGELYFDTKWWNQLPLSVGIRYSRLLNENFAGLSPNQWEIVLPVNLLSR